jgi:hypothetical protein
MDYNTGYLIQTVSEARDLTKEVMIPYSYTDVFGATEHMVLSYMSDGIAMSAHMPPVAHSEFSDVVGSKAHKCY